MGQQYVDGNEVKVYDIVHSQELDINLRHSFTFTYLVD